MGANMLQFAEAPTDIRVHKDRLWFGPMIITHGDLLSALRAYTPRWPRDAEAPPCGRKESPVAAKFTAAVS